ncbi:MAG: tyrosine--tRNA ligase [Tissierellia bacterium]|jgi:tyrosyl-tRNA synthetase|nr:tyrosine--tRNA ligase [Bacillota bacterium]NLK57898.1 tyrosine--tRNA ligase [Tissierellia bacterium]
MSVFHELQERGYLEQCTHEEELKALLEKESVTFYIGFDATADSLTLGHFIQIMVMKRMQNHGHRPIALLGAGTTMIGDPSGRTDMRNLMTKEQIQHNADCFEKQFRRFLDFSEGKAIFENNAKWLLEPKFVEFMRDIGQHFTISRMLAMDAYKNRLGEGLTFFEFGYLLLQSYDFLELFRRHNCKLQMGGSDQWSNIIGGYELVRKIERDEVYGMTFNLLTTATGEKMGKSMKGAVWLDAEKTPPYEMYQYLRNVDDRDVEKFLLQLTFVPTEECKELGKIGDARINEGKERLAWEVVKMIHSEEAANEAQATARALFANQGSDENMPASDIVIPEEGMGLLDLLKEAGLTKSNGEGRRLVEQGGISIDDEKIEDPSLLITRDKDSFVIKKGKKVFHRIHVK